MSTPSKLLLCSAMFLLAFHLPAQTSKEAGDLINAAVATARANAVNDYSYDFTETRQSVTNDLSKAEPVVLTYQYDVTFVDGFPFRRMITKNRLQLDPPSVAAEEAQYQKQLGRLKTMTNADRGKLRALRDRNVLIFNPYQLMAYYFCQVTGHENLEKRANTVVECKERTDIEIPDAIKALLPDVFTFWIDEQQPFFTSTRMSFNTDKAEYGKDSSEVVEWRLIDGVWHHTATRIDFRSTKDRPYGGIITDTFSNFKKSTSTMKFDVDTGSAPATPAAPGHP